MMEGLKKDPGVRNPIGTISPCPRMNMRLGKNTYRGGLR